MATDVMSDVLRSLRLEGTLYFEAHLSGTWGFRVPSGPAASFHHVVEGTCWARAVDRDWFPLGPGSTLVFPHGDAHCLAHRAEVQTSLDGRRLFDRMDGQGVVRVADGSGTETTLICGHFTTDRTLDHPLWSTLPPLVLAENEATPAWSTLARLAAERSRDLSPGARALTDRLAEVLLIELLAELDAEHAPAFTRSLGDPAVASALHAIHEFPATDWDVASLARHAAVSRSTLSQRFGELVGESPKRYVQRWRLHLAAGLLRETDLTTEAIAGQVGYATPFSLSKAFSRQYGQSPGRYREAARRR